jgi:putative ABC transport system substrate-binding protein
MDSRNELTRKRLQLLKDALPSMHGLSVFWDQNAADQWQVAQSVATSLDVKLFGIEFRNPPYDYEGGLAGAPQEFRSAGFLLSSPGMFPDRSRIAEIALKHQAVSMFVFREYAAAGGLFSYGPSLTGMFAHAADYIDRIAKGAKPAELPVEQPTKFDFLINLKTAKALGLAIPSGVCLLSPEECCSGSFVSRRASHSRRHRAARAW